MSTQNKFFIKKNIDPKEGNITGITAVNICDKHLITGDEKGNLIIYEFGQNDKLNKIKETSFKSKIDKILVIPSNKISYVLVGGEIYFVKLPQMQLIQNLFKSKDIVNAFLNEEQSNYKNYILVINKKKKLKLYQIDVAQDKVTTQEKKFPKDFVLEDFPKCGIWTAKNYFVYALKSEDGKQDTSNWLNLDNEKKKSDEVENIVEIYNLGDKVAISNPNYTLFMVDGISFQYSMLLHETCDFKNFCEFKNHLFALCNKTLGVYKAGQQQYDPVETLSLDEGETGKFMVASKYKLVVISESGKKCHFIDFQEKPYEQQIEILLDQKLYDKALEKLLENLTEDDDKRKEKVEALFLDCAWTCLEGNKKDYDNSFKFMSLTNFNPFEFIYMFYESLYVNIIHTDKAKEIKDRKKENQLFGLSAGEEEQKNAFRFLINILKLKRDYILEKIVKPEKSAEVETKKLKFDSSKRGKIYLKDSKITTSVRDCFYIINTTLIKSMIKLKADPKEIEAVLDNETIDISKFDDFEKDEFFRDEKNKNLDETKFTLSYITEKKGNNYAIPLEQWEAFGKSNNKNYSEIGKERTKKIFYKFKENKNADIEEYEPLFRKHIKWLLEKYQTEAFEVVIKTELVSSNIFLDDIIPEFSKTRTDGNTEDLKEKFLEYCNENQKNANYQTQLLELYADKMFKLAGVENKEVKIEGDVKRYYDLFQKIIESEDSVYNKSKILTHIENSWLFKAKIFLYSQLNEHDKALQELFNQAKTTGKYNDIEDFCKQNVYNHHEIFQDFYKLLSKEVQECQEIIDKNTEKIFEKKTLLKKIANDMEINEKTELERDIKKLEEEIKNNEKRKEPFEKEMLNLLEKHGKIDEIDPIKALELANEHWNVCDKNNEFFNYLVGVIKEYTISSNKYKITKSLSEIGLIYKEKEAYEYKKKNVTIDSDKSCDLCKKKIGSTIFVIYPNMKVYHSKCAPNPNIDPMTGVDFSKIKYVE